MLALGAVFTKLCQSFLSCSTIFRQISPTISLTSIFVTIQSYFILYQELNISGFLYLHHLSIQLSIVLSFQADSSDLVPESLPNLDEEGDSTQADMSLEEGVPVVASPDNDEPTDYSDNTEDEVEDVSEGNQHKSSWLFSALMRFIWENND